MMNRETIEKAIVEYVTGHSSSSEATSEIRAALVAALGTVSGRGVTVWCAREGELEPTPGYGAILHVRWAVYDRSHDDWYPTVEAATAALEALAAKHGVTCDPGKLYVNLTSPGCHTSEAWVDAIAGTSAAA